MNTIKTTGNKPDTINTIAHVEEDSSSMFANSVATVVRRIQDDGLDVAIQYSSIRTKEYSVIYSALIIGCKPYQFVKDE